MRQVRSEKAKKQVAITATTSILQPESVVSCNKTLTLCSIFILTPSLEGWPTKAKEAPSPIELRLNMLDTDPVFVSLRENQ